MALRIRHRAFSSSLFEWPTPHTCDRESRFSEPIAFEILHREKANNVLGSIFTRPLAFLSTTATEIVDPAASTSSISMSNHATARVLVHDCRRHRRPCRFHDVNQYV
jgi:hypothetical protein